MLRWLKSLFEKKKPVNTIGVNFRLPDGKEFTVECFKMEYKPNLECKVHRSYIPIRPPDSDCEMCWKIYNLKA